MEDIRTGDEQAPLVYASLARVQALDGPTDGELLALIMKRARDPSIFADHPPYTWRAEASNSTLDCYMTRMDDASLKNYAQDATAGVMFLDSHDKRQLGYGQSIRGEYVTPKVAVDQRKPNDKDPARVLMDFYTIPGIQLGRVSSDSFIAGVQAGIVNDVSIGFLPERFECNLCGKDPFDWWSMECLHAPGAYYDEGGKAVVTPRTKGAVQAFAWVRNARLSEVSAVFDGATSGAYIQKAKFLADAGEISRQTATLLERQLRIRLPEPPLGGSGYRREDGMATRVRRLAKGSRDAEPPEDDDEVTPPPPEEVETPDVPASVPVPASDPAEAPPPLSDTPSPPSENANRKRDESPEGIAGSSGGITSPAHTAPEDLRMNEDRVRDLEAQATRDAEILRRVRQEFATGGIADAETIDPVEGVRALVSRIAGLVPRAQLGDEYRARVIEAALASGVRMDGNEFDRNAWSETFGAMEVKHIQRMGSGWEQIAQAKLPTGRKTADVGTEAPKASRNGQTDTAQYSTH